MQRIALEWLYRLIQEPRRWRRMLRLPRFVWAVMRHREKPVHPGTHHINGKE
jgi:N-acetylglucosaminyldiphosphoundecaprenol N-acetyl-beta-D-mannosaminyltransferase